MKELIDERATAFAIQMNASTCLEIWLAFEMARCSVQCDECEDQLLINKVRIIERVGMSWEEDSALRIDKLGARLAADPYKVQRELAHSKHGTLYLLDKWTLLGDAVESNGGLDDSQITTCYDLLGIDHVYRNGCRRVPPKTDTEGLRALVAREIDRHRSNLERSLNARSDSEKAMAQLSISRYRDPETRGLRSDLYRARRRFTWALDTLRLIKLGADPSTIIDADTGKPIAAGPPASAVPAASRPATPPPPPPPTQPEPAPEPAPAPAASPQPAPPSPTLPPLPEGCSEELKDMLLVAAGVILSASATPTCAEPGPPPTA